MAVYKGDNLAYLKEALDSLYNQTYDSFDIYIQKDGILPYLLEEYLEEEAFKHRYLYLRSRRENKGLAYSLNDLLTEVLPLYEYIARMDSDDICMHDRFEKQYRFMENNTFVDVVGSGVIEFNDSQKLEKLLTFPLLHNEMAKFFCKRTPIPHVTAFFRKSFFTKVGYYDTYSDKAEDILLWLKGFQMGAVFASIKEPLVKVRISDDYFIRRGGLKKAISDFKIRLKVARRLKCGVYSYITALGIFILKLLPVAFKRVLYQRLR